MRRKIKEEGKGKKWKKNENENENENKNRRWKCNAINTMQKMIGQEKKKKVKKIS